MMAKDSIFVTVFYSGYAQEALDKSLRKLALSHDGHWVAQGQLIIEPRRRDIEFEFSNKERVKRFENELHRKYPDVGCWGEGDLDKELAWDIGAEERP